MDAVLREMQRQRAEAFLRSVRVVRHASPARDAGAAADAEVSEECFRLLVKAALEPDKRLMDLYEDLGLHPAKAKQSVSTIEARGFGRVHALARKGRMGAPHGLEVLSAGRALLREHGIAPAEKLVRRGGWRHDVYGRWLRTWARRQGLEVRFEQQVGAKVFDVVTRDKAGLLVGYEIILSGSADWNSAQALRAVGVAGMHEVVLLAEDGKLLKRIESMLARSAGEDEGAAEAAEGADTAGSGAAAPAERVAAASGAAGADRLSGMLGRLRYRLMGDYSPF